MIRFPILNMRRSIAIAVLLLQLSVLFWGALPQALYALHPAMFAAHCVNRAKPMLHCNGKCQMRKATAALMGATAGHSLHGEVQVRAEPPGILPIDDDLTPWIAIRLDPARLDHRPIERATGPDVPPPRGT